MPRCSAAGLDFKIIPAGFNAPLEFLTGFTLPYGLTNTLRSMPIVFLFEESKAQPGDIGDDGQYQ
jgi:hypothetical protein